MKKLFLILALFSCAPILSAQNLYWGGGSANIADGTPPSTTSGRWDTATLNWATDAIGTTYSVWNNANNTTANFTFGAANQTLTLHSNITVGGISLSGSGAGKVVSINQTPIVTGVDETRERMTFAAGAVLDVDGPDSSYQLNFVGGQTNEVATTVLGSLVKTGAGTLNMTFYATNFTMVAGSTFDVQEGVYMTGGNRAYKFSGATLNLAEGTSFIDNISTGGASLPGGSKVLGGLTGTGTFQGGGGTSANHYTRIGSGNVSSTFNGTIEDKALATPMRLLKEGTGTFTMAGLATYAGETLITGGIYELTGESTGEGTLNIRDTGAMELSGTGFYSDLTFEGLDGIGTLTLHEGGLLYVLQSEYTLENALNDISLGNIVGFDGQELAVSTYNDGTVDYTQVNLIPEPSTGALLLVGLAAFVFRRRLRGA